MEVFKQKTIFALGMVTVASLIPAGRCAHKGVLPQSTDEGYHAPSGSIYRLVDTISCCSPTYTHHLMRARKQLRQDFDEIKCNIEIKRFAGKPTACTLDAWFANL